MRREPTIVTERWLEHQKRRGEVRHKPCWQCGRKLWIPRHLFGVQHCCPECEPVSETVACHEAAAEWRRWHTISPLIEIELDKEDEC